MADATSTAASTGGVRPATRPGRGRSSSWARAAARTVLSVAVTLFGLMALTFFIGRMLPLDPVVAILGDNASQASYDAMYAKLGLDQPLWVQFARYCWDLLNLDFGMALTTGRPVIDEIVRVFPATFELATVAIVIGAGLGIPMGVAAAMYRNTLIDHIVRVVGLIGYSVPNFWLGLMGLLLFYATLGWTSGAGRISFIYQWDVVHTTGFLLVDTLIAGQWDVFRDVVSHIILPASILATGAMAIIARMTRSFMMEQLGQEYVIAARIKGLSWRRTAWGHAFRNSAVQVLTVTVLAYGSLLEGAVLVETVFAWPGFGRYLVNGILSGDMNAVVACVMLVGVIFITLNLLSDILYRILDPRTR